MNEYMTSMGEAHKNQYYEHGGARERFSYKCECEIRRNGVLPCGCKWTRDAEDEFEFNWKKFLAEYIALQMELETGRPIMERHRLTRKRVSLSPRRSLKRSMGESPKPSPRKSTSTQSTPKSGRSEKEWRKRSARLG